MVARTLEQTNWLWNHTFHTKVYFNEFLANALRNNMGMIIFYLWDCAGQGTLLTQRSIHPTAPVLLTKDSPRNEISCDSQPLFSLHISNSKTKPMKATKILLLTIFLLTNLNLLKSYATLGQLISWLDHLHCLHNLDSKTSKTTHALALPGHVRVVVSGCISCVSVCVYRNKLFLVTSPPLWATTHFLYLILNTHEKSHIYIHWQWFHIQKNKSKYKRWKKRIQRALSELPAN